MNTASNPSANLPLNGIRVLDMSRVLAGPFCGMMLANLGADVIKVESLNGDETRTWRPFTGSMSGPFQSLNFNKRSLAVDLKHAQGPGVIKRMAAECDVLVENFKTGDMERYGLGYENLQKQNPALVYVSIAAFGHHGPRAKQPGYESLIQAYSGMMSYTGESTGEPVRSGVSFLDLGSGVLGALAAVTALFQRKTTGLGTKVEGSLFQTAIGLMTVQLAPYMMSGVQPQKVGSAHQSITPYQAYPVKDGWVMIAAANQNLWERLAKSLGLNAMLTDARYASNPARMENLDAFTAELKTALGQWEANALIDTLVAAGVPCCRINDIAEMTQEAQFKALDAMNVVKDEEFGLLCASGLPFAFKATPKRAPKRAPKLGEHTQEILQEFGYQTHEVSALVQQRVVA